MKAKYFSLLGIVIFLTTFSKVKAQASTEKENARVFVQKFYDWYNKLYNTDLNDYKHKYSEGLITYVFKNKQQYFDQSLLNPYNDYDKAEPKDADEIVGLDFDPIMNAQDNGEDYQTGSVKQMGDKYFINIHAGMAGHSRISILKERVIITAEVVKENDLWKFVNFQYPPVNGRKNDLITTLINCKKEAEKYTATHQAKTHKS